MASGGGRRVWRRRASAAPGDDERDDVVIAGRAYAGGGWALTGARRCAGAHVTRNRRWCGVILRYARGAA